MTSTGWFVFPNIASDAIPDIDSLPRAKEVESNETQVELRNIEVPFPFVIRKLEESPEGRSIHVVDRLGWRLASPRANFPVMVAQDRHQGR